MKKYIIFGTGSIAKSHYDKLEKEYGAEAIECFIDSMLSQKRFCGKKVITPNQLKEKNLNDYTYILGTLTSKKSMINELIHQGVNEENIVIERDYGSNSFEDNVESASKILLYPLAEESAILFDLDEQFSNLVPNINSLGKKPEIQSVENFNLKNINLVTEIRAIEEYDLILVWDKVHLNDERLCLAKNVYCIDPYYFRMINFRILLRLNLILEKKENGRRYKEASIHNYKVFAQEHVGSNSYIFGTGPSCRKGADIIFSENSIRIACNTLIDSPELMKRINPNIYVISDESMMCKIGKKVIEKIYHYVCNNNCILIVPDILGAVLINRYPKLLKKMVRVSFAADKINFPSPYNMSVYRKAYNIITLLSIPIASYLSDNIYIAGCDGINMEIENLDRNVWKYDEELERNQSITIFVETNEENWEVEYYKKHISYFEEVLEYGEQLGKTYIPYTESYIPALQKRYLAKNKNSSY